MFAKEWNATNPHYATITTDPSMTHPADYLRACNCANWQEAQRLIATGHPDEAILFAAWHSVAMLAPPIEVHELFNTGQAPERPYLIWQNRYDKAALLANRKRAEEEARDLQLHTIEDMLAALQDPNQPLPRRIAAAQGLGNHRHRPTVLPLIEAMNTEDFHLAFACSKALNSIRSRRHLRLLLRYLRASAPTAAKQAAIYSLHWLRERRGQTTLAMLALPGSGEEEWTRVMAAEALINSVQKPFTQSILAKLFSDSNISVRKSALCATALLHGAPLLPVLRRAMASRLEDPEILHDESFGTHVRRILDEHDHSLRHTLDGGPTNAEA